ncbi:hypothetical protein DP43_3640 [Burkholderia pseudomallei]|nr:hypothetical protein DP43_3640 [Burkholderia pseudomallei]
MVAGRVDRLRAGVGERDHRIGRGGVARAPAVIHLDSRADRGPVGTADDALRENHRVALREVDDARQRLNARRNAGRHAGAPCRLAARVEAGQRVVVDRAGLLEAGPHAALAVDAEAARDPLGRIERRARQRRVRNRDVAIRLVEMEKVEDRRILARRHENPVRADGDELPEMLVALRIVHVDARVRRIGERIDGVRDERAAGAAGVDMGAAVEQRAVRSRVRRGDALEVQGLERPLQVAGAVVRVNVGGTVAAEVPAAAPRVVEHVQIAGGVLADAGDAREAPRAHLAFDSRRRVEIAALNAECADERRHARDGVALDVHVRPFVADHQLPRRRVEIERRRLRSAGHPEGVQQRAGRAEFDDLARALARDPDVARAIHGERAGARHADVALPDAVGREEADAIAVEVARIEERAHGGEPGDDVDPGLIGRCADLNRQLARPGHAVVSPDRAAAVRLVVLERDEDRRRVARDRAALKFGVRADRTDALAVLVDRDAALVFVPHRGRVDDAFGRDPHRTRGVAHVGGEGAVGVRQPVGGVLRVTGRRDRGDRRDRRGEKHNVDASRFDHAGALLNMAIIPVNDRSARFATSVIGQIFVVTAGAARSLSCVRRAVNVHATNAPPPGIGGRRAPRFDEGA